MAESAWSQRSTRSSRAPRVLDPKSSPDGQGTAVSLAFPRSVRLRRRRDFLYIQRVGARGSTDALVVIGRPVPRGKGRVGLTVSKKVGKAHDRNLIKRRLRHLLRSQRELFAARDVVIVVRPGATELSFDELGASLREAFARMEHALTKKREAGGRPRRRARRGGPEKSPSGSPAKR